MSQKYVRTTPLCSYWLLRNVGLTYPRLAYVRLTYPRQSTMLNAVTSANLLSVGRLSHHVNQGPRVSVGDSTCPSDHMYRASTLSNVLQRLPQEIRSQTHLSRLFGFRRCFTSFDSRLFRIITKVSEMDIPSYIYALLLYHRLPVQFTDG